MEKNPIDIINSISYTINSLFSNLFSSIDNNLYNALDDLLFIGPDILKDSSFRKIFGTTSAEGVLLICNSMVIAFVIYYLTSLLLSHITFSQVQKPSAFAFKIMLCLVFINFSYFICEKILLLLQFFTLSIRELGEHIFNTSICFGNLIENLNSSIYVENSSINIFSLNGLIKSFSSFIFFNLALSYSLRYIMLKVFLLLTPFSFLSLCVPNSSWFFKSWLKIIMSLMFLQIIVSIILLITTSLSISNDLYSKLLYIGSLYALSKANTFIKEFMGGLSTDISVGINSFKSPQ